GRTVLGRQHRARTLYRGPRSAAELVLHQVDRRLSYSVAVRLAAPEARLAGVTRTAAALGDAVGDGICHQHCAVILGAAVHPSAECVVDPVRWAAVRGAMVI